MSKNKKQSIFNIILSAVLAGLVFGCPVNKNLPSPEPSPEQGGGSLLKRIRLEEDVTYKTITVSSQGETDVYSNGVKIIVDLPAHILEPEKVQVTGKFGTEDIVFTYHPQYKLFFTENHIPGNAGEVKEGIVNASLGAQKDKKTFKVKFCDPAIADMNLVSFSIGKSDVTGRIMHSPAWRIFNDEKNEINFSGEMDKDLSKVIVNINGKEVDAVISGDNKRAFKFSINMEKDVVTEISLTAKAEGAKNFYIPVFTLIFTKQTNIIVSVNTDGYPTNLTDAVLFSKKAFFKTGKTDPEIKVTALKERGDKITKVTVDGQSLNIADTPESTEAVYTVSPAMTAAGEKKTVKLRIEGEKIDGSGICDPTEMEISFELEKFIQGQVYIDSGEGFTELNSYSSRVYNPNIKLKITSDDPFTDVVLKDFKNTDGTVPEFEVIGKIATVNMVLPDTGEKFTKFSVILKAEGKTDTTLKLNLRYSAQPDPLPIGFIQFSHGDVDNNLSKPNEKPALWVLMEEEATLFMLLGRDVNEVTSIKVNNVDCLGTNEYPDPDRIIKKAEITSISSPGGVSKNAVIHFGNVPSDKECTVQIELSGKDNKGRAFAPTKIPLFKVKSKHYEKDDCSWRALYSDGSSGILADSANAVFDEGNWDKVHYNEYGIKSIDMLVKPNNPKAKAKGYWFIPNGDENEPTDENDQRWIKFEKKDISGVSSKFGFKLDTKYGTNQPLSIKLWVESEDGTKNSKDIVSGNSMDPVRALFLDFNYIRVYWSYTPIPDTLTPEAVNALNKMTDTIEIEKTQVAKGNKLYFRAVTFSSTPNYRLYEIKPSKKPAEDAIIDDFVNKDPFNDGSNHEYRFTVDVSKLKNGSAQNLELILPVHIIRPNEQDTTKKDTCCFTYKGKITAK